MSQSLTKTYAEGPVNIIAGDPAPIDQIFTILKGQVLARGDVVSEVTDSGKYQLVDPSKSTGVETPRAIVPFDIDATASDIKAPLYVAGTFDIDMLNANGLSNDALIAAFLGTPIFLKQSNPN